MHLIDLSHTIEPDIPLFSPSAPAPQIRAWQSHTQAASNGHYQDCTCEISEVNFVTSIGTYLDAPFHFHPDKPSIEALRLDQLVLEGVVINCKDASANEPIQPDLINSLDIKGKAVLFNTGWDQYWKTTQYQSRPFLGLKITQSLINKGAKLVGVDFLTVDSSSDPTRPAHVNLLKNEILIVENLTGLNTLLNKAFTFHAVPVKYAGAAAFPIRAYASY